MTTAVAKKKSRKSDNQPAPETIEAIGKRVQDIAEAKKLRGTAKNVLNDEGMPVLGWLVNWSTRQFKIPREDLIKALEDCGIDGKVAREVLPKNAAIRATREFSKTKERFHRKTADKEDVAAFVIATTEVDQKLDAKFETTSKVIFDKRARDLKVEGEKSKEIKEAFERNKTTYSGDQFRSIILRYAKRYCAAVTYLDTGNIYFIPATMSDAFSRLQKLFDILKDRGVSISIKEEIDTKQIRKVMWSVTVGEVQGQIKAMQRDLEHLPDKAKASTLQVRLSRYKTLRTKAQMYAAALQGKADVLTKELDALTAKVGKAMEEAAEEGDEE